MNELCIYKFIPQNQKINIYTINLKKYNINSILIVVFLKPLKRNHYQYNLLKLCHRCHRHYHL
jgi:hypothetical protein